MITIYRKEFEAGLIDILTSVQLNTLWPERKGSHFAGDISKYNFMKDTFGILIKISLIFVAKGPIDNKSALVQVVAWYQTGDKPIRDPMVTMLTDIYVSHHCNKLNRNTAWLRDTVR